MNKIVIVALALMLSGCAAIGPDKFMHATAGLGIGMVGDKVFDGHGCEMAIAAGIVKEMVDPIFSVPDVIATMSYCVIPMLRGDFQ